MATTLNNLAEIYHDQGKYAEAGIRTGDPLIARRTGTAAPLDREA